MSIETLHPQYENYQHKWQKVTDVCDGSDAIKRRSSVVSANAKLINVSDPKFRGSAYLPPLLKQTPAEYAAYRDRALFHNVTGRAASGLVGVMTRLPLKVINANIDNFWMINDDKDDPTSLSLNELTKQCIISILKYDRIGLWVDAPSEGGRPKIYEFQAPSIRNWKIVDNKLVMVVLHTSQPTSNPEDIFDTTSEEVLAHLGIDITGYFVQKYIKDKKGKWEPRARVYPTIGNRPLDYIPFFVSNARGLSWDLENAPLSDIAEINISHYKTSADLEHGRHFTALPTPVIIGMEGADEVRVGSTTAIMIPDPKGDAKYLEFTGQGLQSLEKAITEKEQQMATMSARLIDQNRKGSEAVETVRLRYSGEANTLGSIATAIDGLLEIVLKELALWSGPGVEAPMVKTNKDFLDSPMTAQMLRVLMEMYLEGTLDLDTFLYNLSKSEMVDPEVEKEDLKATFLGLKTNFTKDQLTLNNGVN